jgi:alanine dehydrogenase
MEIGVPKETKADEYRVALTPDGARTLVEAGHRVTVERDAGTGSGFTDEQYAAVGASLRTATEAWDADLVLKVKEPLPPEYPRLKGQMLFTYLHLAGTDPALTDALLRAGTTAVGYETVEDAQGRLPLLAPMSAVAGNMAVTVGNYFLARFRGGKGMLLSEVLGRRFGKVVIVGDGVVGRHAARAADALGAEVWVFGRRRERAAAFRREVSERIHLRLSEPGGIARELEHADLVVGAVLVRGGRPPHVVTEEMVASMEPGSVIVDVSIDQGGCVETSRPTTHAEPVFQAHGVTHYGVTNMPGAYPRLSTLALTDATLPYARRLADQGPDALRADPRFACGLNTYRRRITCRAVAEALDRLGEFAALP